MGLLPRLGDGHTYDRLPHRVLADLTSVDHQTHNDVRSRVISFSIQPLTLSTPSILNYARGPHQPIHDAIHVGRQRYRSLLRLLTVRHAASPVEHAGLLAGVGWVVGGVLSTNVTTHLTSQL